MTGTSIQPPPTPAPTVPGVADVAIVVVTYRSAARIAACLEAIHTATRGLTSQIVVVDNASDDGTADAVRDVLRDTAQHAEVIERAGNDGFAAACRHGVSATRSRYVLFVNPDAVLAPDAVIELLACARRHPDAGIVGGRAVDASGVNDPRSWWGKPTPWSTLCFALGLSSLRPGSRFFDPESPRAWTSDERAVPVVTGALMLVDRRAWDELGGFDPAFFMYGEDADLCLRAAAAGWGPVVTPRAVVQHEGGGSSTQPVKATLLFTGKATLVRRHFPRGLRGAGVLLLELGTGLRAIGSRVVSPLDPRRQGRPTTAGATWRALWDARLEWRRGWGAPQRHDTA